MILENLATKLAKDGVKPPLPKAFPSFIFAVIFLALYLVILLQFFGIRSDILVAIQDFPFQIELLLNVIVIISAIAAVVFLRLPSLNERSWIGFVAIAFFILLFCNICFSCCADDRLACSNNLMCLVAILLFSVIPLIFLTAILRRGVMTNYFSSFLLIGIASGSFSYLSERLISETEDISHLLLWHFAPIFLVILMSSFFVKKFVKSL